LWSSGWFGGDGGDNSVYAGLHTAVEVVNFEAGHDDVGEDSFTGGFGEFLLEGVAGLDPQQMVLVIHEEDRTSLIKLPGVDKLHAVTPIVTPVGSLEIITTISWFEV
jgi:hypothetical protein